MMRGMFAAISGLKAHQVMLDVTAERHRERQHGRLQGRAHHASRTRSRSCSAAPPAPARHRRLQRGAGRPRRAARLDRQPDDRRRAPVDRQPARPRHPGRRLLPGRHRRPDRPSPIARPTTRAPATSRSTINGYLVDAGRLLRRRHQTAGGANTNDVAITIPPASTGSRSARTAACPTRPTRAARRPPYRTHAREVPERPRASSAPAATAGRLGELRHADDRHAGRAAASGTTPPARSRCPTSTSPRSSRT